MFGTFDEILTSISFPCTCRGSGSLVYNPEHSCWLIVLYHLTFPVPNDLASDICGRISVFKKKSDLDARAALANLAAEELLSASATNDLKESHSKKGKKKTKK